ncbi:MAG: type IV pilus secretin PilQ [bacterium]|nr:type IV pilus secretin PilQ [bacterium]
MIRLNKNWLITGLILIFLMGFKGIGWSQVDIFHLTDIRVEDSGNETRVIIVTDKPVGRYYPFTLTEPPSIVVDLYETVYAVPSKKKIGKGGVIEEIRGDQYEERTARVVLAVTELVPYQVSKRDNEIVLDITNPYYKEKAAAAAPRITGMMFDESKNEVIISATTAVEYNHFKKEDPPRVVVEFTGVDVDWKDKVVEVEKGGVTQIRVSRLQDKPVKKVGVVIDLKESLPYWVYSRANQTIVAIETGAEAEEKISPEIPEIAEEEGATEKKSLPAWVKPDEAVVPPTEKAATEKKAPSVPDWVKPDKAVVPPSKKAATEKKVLPARVKPDKPDKAVVPPKKELPIEEVVKEEKVVIEGKKPLISMDFREAEIGDVLRLISHKSGINIVAGKEVTDKVTLRLEGVTWRQTLDMLTRAYGYTYVEEEGIIRVGKALVKGKFTTRIFDFDYADAKEIADSIKPLLTEKKGDDPAGELIVVERTNSIVINDNPAVIEQAADLIAGLDVRTPQVMIEAKIVEVTLRDFQELGIEWQSEDEKGAGEKTWGGVGVSLPDRVTARAAEEEEKKITAAGPGTITKDELASGKGSFFRIGTVRGEFNIEARLNALVEDAKADILSNPRILAIDNKEARIMVGDEFPIKKVTISEGKITESIEYRDLGIKLYVTPKINSDGYVVLKVHPEVSAFTTYALNGNPIFSTRETESEILVKDGETIVIGGLIQNEKKETISKVPILGDIPLLGLLFKNRSVSGQKTELLIFITTTIKRG